MPNAKRHTHKYFRKKTAYLNVWACALPTCSHFMPPHLEDMVEGKATICWNYGNDNDCEKITIMDSRTMKMDKPKCQVCDKESAYNKIIETIIEDDEPKPITNLDAIQEKIKQERQEAFEAAAAISKKDGE